LQAQLEGTENRITVERQKFNAVVQTYDTGVKVFPGVLFAGFFGFAAKPYFTAQANASTPPSVSFSFGDAPTPAAKP
jgi:LemA protein